MMFGNNPGTNETWKRIPQDSVGVELGVWKGESSAKFLKRAKFIHLVDPWSAVAYEDSDEFGDYQGFLDRYSKLVGSNNPADFQKYYDNIATTVEQRFDKNCVKIHRMTTDEFFNTFEDKVSWVYVDALHSFDGCLNDLRNSRTIIEPGGYIFGDDYGDNKPGVRDAVNAFIAETGLVLNNFHSDQFEIQVT